MCGRLRFGAKIIRTPCEKSNRLMRVAPFFRNMLNIGVLLLWAC